MTSGLSASLAFTAFPRDHFTLLAGGSASCFGIVGAQLANCVLNWAQMHSDHVALHAGFIPRSYARLVMRESLDSALTAAKAKGFVHADETCEASEAHYSFFESLLTGRSPHDPHASARCAAVGRSSSGTATQSELAWSIFGPSRIDFWHQSATKVPPIQDPTRGLFKHPRGSLLMCLTEKFHQVCR